MGIRITSQEDKVALFDSTNGRAFGTVFDSEYEAEEFMSWFDDQVTRDLILVQTDLRDYRPSDFDILVQRWRDTLEFA